MVVDQFVVCFVSLLLPCLLCASSVCAQELRDQEALVCEPGPNLTECLASAPETAGNERHGGTAETAASATDCGEPASTFSAKEHTLHGQASRNVRKFMQNQSVDTRNFSSIYEAEVTGDYSFDNDNCRALALHGVVAEPIEGQNGVNFHSGSLLLSCSVPVNVKVRNALVKIAGGSIVFIKANQYVALVMNLHDEHHRSVVVHIGERSYTLTPGRELVLTSMLNLTYDEANLTPGIWYRSVQEDFPLMDTKVFLTQFSTLSTLRVIPVVRKVASFRKHHGDKIVKTAAAVYAVSRDRHEFRWKLDDAEVHNSRHESELRMPAVLTSHALPPSQSEPACSATSPDKHWQKYRALAQQRK